MSSCPLDSLCSPFGSLLNLRSKCIDQGHDHYLIFSIIIIVFFKLLIDKLAGLIVSYHLRTLHWYLKASCKVKATVMPSSHMFLRGHFICHGKSYYSHVQNGNEPPAVYHLALPAVRQLACACCSRLTDEKKRPLSVPDKSFHFGQFQNINISAHRLTWHKYWTPFNNCLPVCCLEVYHSESLRGRFWKGNINGIKERLKSSTGAVGGGY